MQHKAEDVAAAEMLRPEERSSERQRHSALKVHSRKERPFAWRAVEMRGLVERGDSQDAFSRELALMKQLGDDALRCDTSKVSVAWRSELCGRRSAASSKGEGEGEFLN